MPWTEAATDRSALVAKRFGARAGQYDEHALLQRESAATLAAFIASQGGLPPAGLLAEIGCGTGLLAELLAPQVELYLATDIAPEMLERCRLRLHGHAGASFALMDGQRPAFAQAPAGIVSNLAAQWFVDPVAGLERLAGQTPFFAFAVPLAGSFPEWREAFRALGREPGLLPMPKGDDIMRALTTLAARTGKRTRFRTEAHTLRYANARAFADSFRNIGADQPRPGYRPGPIRPVLQRFAKGMEATAFVLYGLIKKESA